MKKIGTLILTLCLILSIGQVVYAESAEESAEFKQAKEYASKLSNDEMLNLCEYLMGYLSGNGTIEVKNVIYADLLLRGVSLESLQGSTDQTKYSFGQGTFIVGQDLKAGTYDITCTSTTDENMGSGMNGFSDFYASRGMSEYADMFGSLGDMYSSIGGMTVKTYKANTNYSDQYLTLKSGETARIILEDGGKIEISDGTAELTWIR